MTTQTNAASSAQPGNTYLNGIWWNTEWVTNGDINGAVTLTWASSAAHPLNAGELAAVAQIFADISAVCNITFQSGAASGADILLNADTFGAMNAEYQNSLNPSILGIADPPGTYPPVGDEQSWVFANRSNYSPNGLNKGGYDYITWLHEIGHVLGLAHPHDNGGGSAIFPGVFASGDVGTDALNQGIYTTMSYNDGLSPYAASLPKQFGWQATMMAFDVAALQLKYGANSNQATGNTTYQLRDSTTVGAFGNCIWDAGGTDTISYGGFGNAIIDLRAATLTSGYGAGGYLSYVMNNPYNFTTIAAKAEIENATSSSGNDTLIGNNSGNSLTSGSGADTIYALAGNDSISTGAGNDTAQGGDGADTLYGGLDADILYGQAQNDNVYGGSGFDNLFGGDGDDLAFGEGDIDYIYGNTGNDRLYGGSGNDIIYGGDGADRILGDGGLDLFYGGGGADYFNLSLDLASGGFDRISDLQTGIDFIIMQASLQTSLYYFMYGTLASCYVTLAGGGGYSFSVDGVTLAQLQSSVSVY